MHVFTIGLKIDKSAWFQYFLVPFQKNGIRHTVFGPFVLYLWVGEGYPNFADFSLSKKMVHQFNLTTQKGDIVQKATNAIKSRIVVSRVLATLLHGSFLIKIHSYQVILKVNKVRTSPSYKTIAQKLLPTLLLLTYVNLSKSTSN